MTQVANTFEGGSNGTTLTAGSGGNTGGTSGDYFDQVLFNNTGTPGIVQFSNAVTPHRGSLCCAFAPGSVSAATAVGWVAQRGTLADDYVRSYVYFPVAFAINEPAIQWFSTAANLMGTVRLNAARTISVLNASSGVLATSTATLSTGAWHRLEAHYSCTSGTTAEITVRLFLGANVDGSTPDETISPISFATVSGTSDRVYFGLPSASATDVGKLIYYDDVIAGGTTWLGPTSLTKVGAGIIGP